MSPMQAAVEGTREIGLAVLATTLSLVAIFAPVGFMSGMVGRFMRSFGLTMAFAVMVSLLVSFTLTPTMCARWLKVKPREEDESHHVRDSKHSAIFGPIDRIYTRMLEWSMAHRGIIADVGGAGAVLERAHLPRRQRELHPAGRPIGVRRQSARARGHQSRGDRSHGESCRDRDPRAARGRLHHGDGGRRLGRHVEYGIDLRPTEANRGTRSGSVRPHGRSAKQRSSRRSAPEGVRTSLQAPGIGGRRWRRRWAGTRRHSARDAGTEPVRIGAGEQFARRVGEEDSRTRRRGHVAARRQTGDLSATRPTQGSRPRCAGL